MSWPYAQPLKTVAITPLELPPHVLATHTVEGYNALLVKQGWKKVGEGVSSNVFVKNGYALKVSVNDYGYDAFVEQALNRQDNPFFPRIYEVKRYLAKLNAGSARTEHVTLVLMEELKLNAKSATTDGTIWEGRGMLAHKMNMDRAALAALSLEELDTAVALGKLFQKFGVSDLHQDNIMYRGTQPVIIDPVIYRYNHDFFYHE